MLGIFVVSESGILRKWRSEGNQRPYSKGDFVLLDSLYRVDAVVHVPGAVEENLSFGDLSGRRDLRGGNMGGFGGGDLCGGNMGGFGGGDLRGGNMGGFGGDLASVTRTGPIDNALAVIRGHVSEPEMVQAQDLLFAMGGFGEAEDFLVYLVTSVSNSSDDRVPALHR